MSEVKYAIQSEIECIFHQEFVQFTFRLRKVSELLGSYLEYAVVE